MSQRQVWFTADSHFGHANIINLCKRPFKDVNEMDNVLIHNWNVVVQPGDLVYHLGDFSMGYKDADSYLNRLHGSIRLTVGNHEKKALRAAHRFESIDDLSECTVDGLTMVLCHYPLLAWNHSHHGSAHLHGHCHGNLPNDPHALRLDVGLTVGDSRPFLSIRSRLHFPRRLSPC